MKLFSVGGVQVKVHPLLCVMSIMWAVTGYLGTAATVYAVLLLHEGAHMVAAALFRVRIFEVKLLPFGSVASMDDVFEHAPLQEAVIAAAGPAASIIGAFAGVTLSAYFPDFAPARMAEWIHYSFFIAAFNLLPAMPLDGGRVLRACLAGWCGFERATQVSAWLGTALGAVLCIYGVASFFSPQAEVLTLFLGAFLLLSASQERKKGRFASARRMVKHLQRNGEVLRVRTLAVPQALPLWRAASMLCGNRYYLFCVTAEDHTAVGELDEAQVMQAFLSRDGHTPIGELIARKH